MDLYNRFTNFQLMDLLTGFTNCDLLRIYTPDLLTFKDLHTGFIYLWYLLDTVIDY